MNCVVCGKIIEGRKRTYCSVSCREKNKSSKRFISSGSRSKNLFKDLVEKFLGGECEICGSKKNLIIHHIIPISLGGKNEPINVMCLCSKCHNNVHRGGFKKALDRLILK